MLSPNNLAEHLRVAVLADKVVRAGRLATRSVYEPPRTARTKFRAVLANPMLYEPSNGIPHANVGESWTVDEDQYREDCVQLHVVTVHVSVQPALNGG